MNMLLPISQIANEVIYDYNLPGASSFSPSWRNNQIADTYMKAVAEITDDKNQYVHVLYELIVRGRK